jgi:hypothetical protein
LRFFDLAEEKIGCFERPPLRRGPLRKKRAASGLGPGGGLWPGRLADGSLVKPQARLMSVTLSVTLSGFWISALSGNLSGNFPPPLLKPSCFLQGQGFSCGALEKGPSPPAEN